MTSDRAPVRAANASTATESEDEEMPRMGITRERALLFGFFVISAIAFLYFVLPKLAGLHKTWDRLDQGDPWWLGAAFGFELLSFCGYVWLFRTVFIRGKTRIGWLESYEITMAGLAATRLFAAAGAGGIALTAWALRRSGMEARMVACRMVAFMGLLYLAYVSAVVLAGVGLRIGLFHGDHPFGFTVVPAIVGVVLIGLALAITFIRPDMERRLIERSQGSGRLARILARLATVPATSGSGLRTAFGLVRDRELGVLGAVVWWGFDIAVLWACFNAFGHAPPGAVVVMAYFIGMIANTLPLPGGIGGVDGGMIGTFLAFGVDGGLAVVAVLVYRGFAFWLPTLPGAVAYLQLRRTVARWKDERRAERLGPEPTASVTV